MKVILYSCAMIGGYLVGALPSGFWIAQSRGIQDITKHGSGNIGATNVARFLGIYYFFVVFLLDFFKAFLYLKFLGFLDVPKALQIGAAIILLIGNGYSVFLKGYGGKGVATSLGILGAFVPSIILYPAGIWVLGFLGTQTMGIASCIALVSLPCASFFLDNTDIMLGGLMVFISVWGLFRHRNNVMKYFNITTL